MDFFDKMYVGFNRQRYNTSDVARILGFAVPYADTKAAKKRMGTVDDWRDKDVEPKTYDNKPMRGFKLVEVVSRYSTSNKLFRVLDPRGFELEISADNLLDLAMDCTIVRGEIIEECVWVGNGKIYLLNANSDLYKLYLKNKTEGKVVIEPGKYYQSLDNKISVFRFEGIMYSTCLEVSHKATQFDVGQDSRFNDSYYSHRYKTYTINEYETTVNILLNGKSKKKVYVYTEYFFNDDGEITQRHIHVRSGHLKNLVPYDTVSEEVMNDKPDLTQWAKNDLSDKFNNYPSYMAKFDTLVGANNSYENYAFFHTKEEALAYDYTDAITKTNPTSTRIYSVKIVNDNSYYNNTQFSKDVVQKFIIKDLRNE